MGSQYHLGLGVATDEGHIGREENAFHMHHVELFILQHLAQFGGKSLAAIAFHMVGLAAEQRHSRRQGLYSKVDIHRLEAGGLTVALRQAVYVGRMLVGLHREHPHLAASLQQSLRDAVHGHRPAVDRRDRGLVA